MGRRRFLGALGLSFWGSRGGREDLWRASRSQSHGCVCAVFVVRLAPLRGAQRALELLSVSTPRSPARVGMRAEPSVRRGPRARERSHVWWALASCCGRRWAAYRPLAGARCRGPIPATGRGGRLRLVLPPVIFRHLATPELFVLAPRVRSWSLISVELR